MALQGVDEDYEEESEEENPIQAMIKAANKGLDKEKVLGLIEPKFDTLNEKLLDVEQKLRERMRKMTEQVESQI